MPRVIGIDPGTVSIDLCGLDDGHLFLDRSWPTAEALADPAPFVAELEAAGPLDLVVGPSGYGLPITRVQDITSRKADAGERARELVRSEEHTSELQSRLHLVCRLLLEKKKNISRRRRRGPQVQTSIPSLGCTAGASTLRAFCSDISRRLLARARWATAALTVTEPRSRF